MKRLFLIANAFPFGTWEPYLETEVEYYGLFDRIEVFSLSVRPEQFLSARSINDPKVQVHPIPFRSRLFYALYAIRVLGDGEFYREILRLARAGRFSCGRLVQLVVFLARCHYEAREIVRIVRSKRLTEANDSVVLYSYRLAYQPYLSELLSRQIPDAVRIARAHRADLYEELAPNAYIPLRDRTVRALDAISMISLHGFDYLSARHSEALGRMRLDRLGTRDYGLGPVPADRAVLRIVTCATIVPVKRLDLLVDALALIDGRQIRWTHFGEGPLRAALEQRAANELGGNVKFEFRGALSNEKVLEQYQSESFHAFVSVSESEGLPVSMMEACSFGIPVVATDVGGCNEIVKSGVSGILMSADPRPTEVADALASLSTMGEAAYRQLRNGARRVWEDEFNAASNYQRFVQALVQLGDSNRVAAHQPPC